MSAVSSGEIASFTAGGEPDQSAPGFDRGIALAAGAVTFAVGTVALIGWALGSAELTSLWPGGAPMTVRTAIGLKAGAASLMLAFASPRLRPLRIVLALALAGSGLLFLAGQALAPHSGASAALAALADLSPDMVRKLQPYIASANSLAIGIALTLVASRNAAAQVLRAALAMGAFIMATTCLLGYLISPIDPAVPKVLFGTPFNSSFAFMTLSAGVLAAGRNRPSGRHYLAPVVGLIALGALVAISLVNVGLHERAQTQARQADRIGAALARLFDVLQNAEIDQRDSLLTGDEPDLAPSDAAARAVAEQLGALEALIGDDAAARAQLARVQALAFEELAELRRTIDVRRAGDAERALAVLRSGAGKATMESLRRAMAAMQGEKARHATELADAARAHGVQLQISTLATVSLVGLLLAFMFLDSRRRFQQLWRTQDQLRSLNQSLDQLVARRTADLSAALAERGRAEEALRNSETAVLESPAVGIAQLSPDGRFLRVNARLCSLVGYSSGELLQRSLTDVTHPDDVPVSRAQVASLISGGIPHYSLEKRLIAKGGRLVWVNMTRSLVRTPTGDPDYFVVLIEDICARKAADLALQEREARLRSIIDTAPDALIAICGRGLIETFSRSAERLFGYEASEVMGRPIDALIPSLGENGDVDMERLAPAEQRATGGRSVQATAERRNGSAFPVELSVGEALIGESRIITVFIRDLTARQRIEQQLRQAQRMEAIGQLTGGLAHDFNNLLTVIMGNLEMLEQGPASQREIALVREARETAEDGARLVRDLLAFGRRQALQPQLTDLGAFVRSMEALLRRTLGETIDVATDLETGVHWSFVDGSQLQNALLNLVINARDAMPGGGDLVINLQNVVRRVDLGTPLREGPNGRYAQITVTDTGVGMSKETQQRVFEPFFTTKPAGVGTGLGLSMVYGFAKQSSGFVELSSEPGRGTSVRLLLPACEAPPETGETTAASDTQAWQGGGEKILVVEDDPRVRRVTMARLTELGYEAREAHDARSALELAARAEIDLLFTDIVMPGGMTGFDLAKTLRATRPTLKVLYTSGYAEPELVTRHQGEQTHWLGKPYSASELAKALREALAGATEASR